MRTKLCNVINFKHILQSTYLDFSLGELGIAYPQLVIATDFAYLHRVLIYLGNLITDELPSVTIQVWTGQVRIHQVMTALFNTGLVTTAQVRTYRVKKGQLNKERQGRYRSSKHRSSQIYNYDQETMIRAD